MAYLLDTSVLVRFINASDAQHSAAFDAIQKLHDRGEILHVTPQVLVEFRNATTRPVAVNGLGLNPSLADRQIESMERVFPLLPDLPDIHPAWKAIVASIGVIGKQVHDARIVAVCKVHQVSHLLTFNTQHFVRLAMAPSVSVAVVHPSQA